MIEWWQEHRDLADVIGLVAILISVLGVLLVPILISVIPTDYFAKPEPPPSRWKVEHRQLRRLLAVLKNLIGIVFVLLGVAMLVLPGQGILTILLGVMMVDFPVKRRLELWLVSRPRVRVAVNWIRTRSGRAPLEFGSDQAM